MGLILSVQFFRWPGGKSPLRFSEKKSPISCDMNTKLHGGGWEKISLFYGKVLFGRRFFLRKKKIQGAMMFYARPPGIFFKVVYYCV